MNKQQKNIQYGPIFNFHSANKQQQKAGTIYLSWVNQLSISRQQPIKPSQTSLQYLSQNYQIEDKQNPNTQHTFHSNVHTIFDALKEAGCNVSYLSDEEEEKRKEETDVDKLMEYVEREEGNRVGFLEEFGIGEVIKDCWTVYYEDVGAEITMIMVFRDQHYWYRLDSDRTWPGYQY